MNEQKMTRVLNDPSKKDKRLESQSRSDNGEETVAGVKLTSDSVAVENTSAAVPTPTRGVPQEDLSDLTDQLDEVVDSDAAVVAQCGAKEPSGKGESEQHTGATTTAPSSPNAHTPVAHRNAQFNLMGAKDREKYSAMSDGQRRNYNAKCRRKYHRQMAPSRLKHRDRERQQRRRQSYVALTAEEAMERYARRERLDRERCQRSTPLQLEARRKRATATTWNRLGFASSQVSSIVSDDDSDSQPEKKQLKVPDNEAGADFVGAMADLPQHVILTLPTGADAARDSPITH